MQLANPMIRYVWVTAACLAIPSLSAIWAFRPLTPRPIRPMTIPVASGEHDAPRRQLDITTFMLPLWVAPPAPPEPEPEPSAPPPPAPLRLELIAVIEGEEVFSAVLYDPQADRLLVLNAGESIQEGQTIEQVTARGVVVRSHDGMHRLALREGIEP